MDRDRSAEAGAPKPTADRWEPASRRGNRWFGIAMGAALVAAAIALGVAVLRGWRPSAGGTPKPPPTAADFKAGAMHCMQVNDLDCAEFNWAEYVRQRPTDGRGLANLGIVLNMRDKHEQAAAQLRKAIDGGEGTYDLFAYYADSLTKLGRIDEAIDWSYRSLSIMPALVDVRGNLAKLLLQRQRGQEALALLAAYDADAEGHGRPPYFAGQRISIENVLEAQARAQGPADPKPLRLTAIGGHFFVPVTLGQSRPTGFVVDTGATHTTMSRSMLKDSRAEYRVTEPNVIAMTADGRRTQAQGVVVAALRVGPHELRNVRALVCENCVPLLGQSTLAQFDMQSSRVQGVDFMTLSRRADAARGKPAP